MLEPCRHPVLLIFQSSRRNPLDNKESSPNVLEGRQGHGHRHRMIIGRSDGQDYYYFFFPSEIRSEVFTWGWDGKYWVLRSEEKGEIIIIWVWECLDDEMIICCERYTCSFFFFLIRQKRNCWEVSVRIKEEFEFIPSPRVWKVRREA